MTKQIKELQEELRKQIEYKLEVQERDKQHVREIKELKAKLRESEKALKMLYSTIGAYYNRGEFYMSKSIHDAYNYVKDYLKSKI